VIQATMHSAGISGLVGSLILKPNRPRFIIKSKYCFSIIYWYPNCTNCIAWYKYKSNCNNCICCGRCGWGSYSRC
jgi:hypothetical protein